MNERLIVLASIVFGLLLVLGGVFLLFGFGVVMIVAGLVFVALGLSVARKMKRG